MLRFGALVVGLLAACPAVAQEMKADEARKFVVGKLFTYNCFEGTKGTGRINHDGSVAGTIQFQGSGPVRYAVLPANTLRVKGEQVCAFVKGLPFEPCFNVQRTSHESFRGAISGMSFAACEFKRRGGRAEFANAVTKPYQAAAAQPKRSGE
ncbi:MAG: hypothetical protein RO009_02565 [Pseudorhodoplanes sp.]|jgi:hypothetical protein|nr:hypothetical protein [Pseudorhodoplanes sp.]